MTAECLKDPEIRVIFLDTLRFMAGPPQRTEGNAQDRDFEQLRPIQQWSLATGVAVVAVAHTNKAPDSSIKMRTLMASVAGSNLITATADTVLSLTRVIDKTTMSPSALGTERRRERGRHPQGHDQCRRR
jgi:replicative DNA helicase